MLLIVLVHVKDVAQAVLTNAQDAAQVVRVALQDAQQVVRPRALQDAQLTVRRVASVQQQDTYYHRFSFNLLIFKLLYCMILLTGENLSVIVLQTELIISGGNPCLK